MPDAPSPIRQAASPGQQRRRILAAAAELFQRRGYPATSVRQIAEAVGLGASSLYNHIDGKAELLREICFASARRFEDGLEALVAGSPSSDAALQGVIELHVAQALEFPETVTVFNDEWRHLGADDLAAFAARRRRYETRVGALLLARRTDPDAGGLDPLTPADERAVATLLASLSWVYQLKPAQRPPRERLVAELHALWAAGWPPPRSREMP